MPLPWWQTLATFAYAVVFCLFVNDAVKVAMIRWLVLQRDRLDRPVSRYEY
jgi:hypothetical protein